MLKAAGTQESLMMLKVPCASKSLTLLKVCLKGCRASTHYASPSSSRCASKRACTMALCMVMEEKGYSVSDRVVLQCYEPGWQPQREIFKEEALVCRSVPHTASVVAAQFPSVGMYPYPDQLKPLP